ncbi:MAG: hypothetical protein V1796_07025 [Pseudomonadota bacterium]
MSEARRLPSENKLYALPLVDDGRLRGLVTGANLLRLVSVLGNGAAARLWRR